MYKPDYLVSVLFRKSGVSTLAWDMLDTGTKTESIGPRTTLTIKTRQHTSVSASEAPWFGDGLAFGGLDLRRKAIHATVEIRGREIVPLKQSKHFSATPIVTTLRPFDQDREATIDCHGTSFLERSPNMSVILYVFRNQLPSLFPFSLVELLPARPPNTRYADHEQGGQIRTAKTIKGVLETCGSRNIVV